MNNWKILLVDDEEDIHILTKIILKDIAFQNKNVKLISAYSAKQAKKILEKEPDIALAIVDIVMETESAGLELVRYIRETLKNDIMRIVIRTGQPGYAPPREVILKYDINDYREKSELSSNGLFTMIIARLREYAELKNLYEQRKLLERFSMLNPEDINSVNQLREKIENILNMPVKIIKSDFNVKNFVKISWIGKNKVIFNIKDENYIIDFATSPKNKGLISLVLEKLILDIENNMLYKEKIDTLYQIIYVLSEITETRSLETGEHVKRVSNITQMIAKNVFKDEEYVNLLSIAAMLHDIGKIGIPDKILNKPEKLSDSEWEIMKTHTEIGYNILKSVNSPLFNIAANIALYHHENWDGSGYPKGLKWGNIPIEARIVSIADVYDALSNDRIYRKAWPKDKVLRYIKENAGKKFDPRLVEIFFDEIGKFLHP
ncbi:phosphohydrolase [Thermosipho melanesiensis]|uniref:Response regulator receiver modulated metal dependent phosphohydrolase n=2 Tax=Thermosipho melanesiensis TaxID=46541 RepID=A6LKB3_THEM4|nr:HD domain-containing phosphohydrolase [Thermosipho melanesiensis]ABR30364.1 response regulator receiver modulated metal dependent phosphohydrolase [Thermosipho melanesiensis BI429]APT73529.1 phosphohydrolase [Thermosipho melanesiensis]OOC37480.1 phosphohydrolase [Thermosipho melanesiensis]OOC39619.1 phosphohydrolase [Thermosipho melanesiensis]OOC39637.1 phosphohydrolase [Thermosipho melanesiensis]